MNNRVILSDEAENVLKEIIDNEQASNYWESRFNNLSSCDDAILRGCFKELRESGMISVSWADNHPYIIQVLKDGYLYGEKKEQERCLSMSQFERELNDLLERSKSINRPANASIHGTDLTEYNQPSQEWINDVEIFYNRYLKDHALGSRIKTILVHRNLDAYTQLVSCLKSISKDQYFIDIMNGINNTTVPTYQAKMLPEYDVFLSHANSDKEDLVDALHASLDKLGVKIFYDKKTLEWGDIWKDRILAGTRKAEFAIIVISKNFFDREWTEKELNQFLNRQNKNGQKLILPIVHNITNEDLRKKYPSIADIQAIDSKQYSCDEIALLFARQLIKRLKAQQ